MKIDSHQHFWNYSSDEYVWIDEKMEILKRDFLPRHLAPLVKSIGFDGTIAVQARQSIDETEWLLGLAEKNDLIKGVVGWIPLCSSSVNDHLNRFSKSDKLVGVRHVLQDESDNRFMLRPDFLNGLKCLSKYDLAYDLLIFPKQLEVAAELVSQFPEQRFILDHIAKPPIKERWRQEAGEGRPKTGEGQWENRPGTMDDWEVGIKRLAHFPNVWCKLSGMVTEADWYNWEPAHLIPYLEVVLEAFGSDRLMIGSDWPVCTVAGEYKIVMNVVLEYISALSKAEQAAISGGNAVKFYKL